MKKVFEELHPFSSSLYFFGFILLNMIFMHPIYLASGLIGIVLVNVCVDRGQQLRSFLPYYILTGIAVTLANPLFSHRGRYILFYFMNQPITFESVLYGVTMMLSLLNILVCFVAYNQVVSSGKFLFLFSRAFQKVGLLIMLSVRFVPLVKRRMSQIMMVQKTRGVNPWQGAMRKRIADATRILEILITWSLEEALQTAASMKARGYGIRLIRSSYHPYRFHLIDFFWIGTLVCLISICIAEWFRGYGVLPIYPVFHWAKFDDTQWFLYACFCLYTIFPVLLEGKERIRWQSWK
ncbi:energy-coupling factor transporter transmembrane protein EcfT [Fodinisporobacter ferrooxydans]|uniref:Energy-coupling factor transporter transmembrane protein EcfT n=1 Tax=Fodinisporobacter ferrooxydans TaxID=2901836 RepID=A0ABY4CXG8_9BACL|nr:energy-coupling factor transporter transmembrane protein EcfT [Alicyclobacillaceae bacterium MYW30-H2]